ncbi:MAG: LacI family DNA-binding transcriptional regulator [Bauldia sp.]|nr:LacI family DNA-binding transcriptional regulator [Bauldia sp.]
MRGANIRKVAELAGVSTATVSRALTQPDRVAEATRARVLEAVRSTGFVPNRQAVNFRRQTTGNVVLLVRDISNPFYLDIYGGVEEHAFANGYRVLMGDAGDDDARVRRYVEMVRNRQADGLILMTGWLPKGLADGPLPPMVVALEQLQEANLPTIAIDNRKAARLAVEHLIGLGHQRIAHLTGPMRLVMSHERQAGYLEALAAAGIERRPELIFNGNFHYSSGRDAVAAFGAAGVGFTAIFAANDEMAIGAVNELRARGQRVPDDVSVVGFDDLVYAESSDPPLTTIRQPRRAIGSESMRMMISLLQGSPSPADRVEAAVELIVRASTARAATTRRRTHG